MTTNYGNENKGLDLIMKLEVVHLCGDGSLSKSETGRWYRLISSTLFTILKNKDNMIRSSVWWKTSDTETNVEQAFLQFYKFLLYPGYTVLILYWKTCVSNLWCGISHLIFGGRRFHWNCYNLANSNKNHLNCVLIYSKTHLRCSYIQIFPVKDVNILWSCHIVHMAYIHFCHKRDSHIIRLPA
jgi:hypothetical protein